MIAVLGALVLSAQPAQFKMPESSKPTPLPSFLNALPKIGTELFVNDQEGVEERYRVSVPTLRVGDFTGALVEDLDVQIGRKVMYERPLAGKVQEGIFGGTDHVLWRNGISRNATSIDTNQLRTYEVITRPPAGSGKDFLALFGKIQARLGPPSLIATNERPNKKIKLADWERSMPKEWRNALTRPVALEHLVPGFNTRAYTWIWGTGSVDLYPSRSRGSDGPTTVLYLTFTSATAIFDAQGKLISRQPNYIHFGIDILAPFE